MTTLARITTRRFIALFSAMILSAACIPSTALASEVRQTPEQLVADALRVVGQPMTAQNPQVQAGNADAVGRNAGVEVSVDAAQATAGLETVEGQIVIAAEDEQDTVVMEHPDGAQLATVLRDGESSARFVIHLPGQLGLVQEEESFSIRSADGSLVGGIAPPWAVDATGARLATHYELVGNVMVQHVDTAGAVYPVVADPSVTVGSNIYLWLRGWELAALYGAGAAGIAAFFCAVYGALHPIMCAIVAASAAGLATAVGYFYLQNPPANCRFVIAIRPWGAINYMERRSGNGCSYYRYELPG